MTQPTLFPLGVGPYGDPLTQAENLARVRSRIAALVVEFWRRLMAGKQRQFHMAELTDYVAAAEPGVAPDSPGRILRDLRQAGAVNYRVVVRSESLYEAMELT